MTVPSTKPAPVIAEVANACVAPTTFGTATVACLTVKAAAKVAISGPVVTVTVRGPNVALAATAYCTVRLVRLDTDGLPALIPAPAVTWLTPLINCCSFP